MCKGTICPDCGASTEVVQVASDLKQFCNRCDWFDIVARSGVCVKHQPVEKTVFGRLNDSILIVECERCGEDLTLNRNKHEQVQ